jgi:hypothetical protein
LGDAKESPRSPEVDVPVEVVKVVDTDALGGVVKQLTNLSEVVKRLVSHNEEQRRIMKEQVKAVDDLSEVVEGFSVKSAGVEDELQTLVKAVKVLKSVLGSSRSEKTDGCDAQVDLPSTEERVVEKVGKIGDVRSKGKVRAKESNVKDAAVVRVAVAGVDGELREKIEQKGENVVKPPAFGFGGRASPPQVVGFGGKASNTVGFGTGK